MKVSNNNFHEDQFDCSGLLTCGQTDRHGLANRCIFATSVVNAPNKASVYPN